MARAVTDPAPILEDVAVAGLLIPAPLATRIIAALRSVYPTLTEGKDDDPAVRAVLIYWITAALETYEGNQLREQTNAAIETVRVQGNARAEKIRAEVRKAAGLIRETPTVEPPPAPTGRSPV